jgi:hypothetical protein
MTTRRGPGNGPPGHIDDDLDGTAPPPTVSLYERQKRHLDYWSIAAHRHALDDACHDLNARPSRKGRPKVHPDRVRYLLLVLAYRAHHAGVIANSTVRQLSDETGMNEQRVKDALTVATSMGLLVTVDKARQRRPNARGQAPRRHLAYLVRNGEDMLTISPTDEMVREVPGIGAPVRTTSTDEMVRDSTRIGAPVRTPLPNALSALSRQSDATSAAQPTADDGASYATHRVDDLRRRVVDRLADEHGTTAAQIRSQYGRRLDALTTLLVNAADRDVRAADVDAIVVALKSGKSLDIATVRERVAS